MDTKFNCPQCGAPGEVIYGQATYTCNCRFRWWEFPSSPPPPTCPLHGYAMPCPACPTQMPTVTTV